MARPLRQIRQLAADTGAVVVYAGDIFDRWHAGPEVINFALAELPHGYAVPGQHDLPNHSYEEIKRAAYWTLVEAGCIENLPPGRPHHLGYVDNHGISTNALVLYGYPWGHPITPITPPGDGNIHIAVIHRFVWCKGTGYPGAPEEGRMRAYRGALAGYDVAHFGDNHKGFLQHPKGGPWVCNSGGLMRRKTDERGYQPAVGLVHGDGTVTRHTLDTAGEVFAAATEAELLVDRVLDMSDFVDGLRGLGADDALDFTTTLKRFLDNNNIPAAVRRVVLEAHGGV